MGRVVVVEVRCDRCRKVEHRKPDGNNHPEEPAFVGKYKGQTVTYQDLCEGCDEVIKVHWGEIARDMKKVSPRKNVKTGAIEKPAAVPPAIPKPKTDSHGPSQRS